MSNHQFDRCPHSTKDRKILQSNFCSSVIWSHEDMYPLIVRICRFKSRKVLVIAAHVSEMFNRTSFLPDTNYKPLLLGITLCFMFEVIKWEKTTLFVHDNAKETQKVKSPKRSLANAVPRVAQPNPFHFSGINGAVTPITCVGFRITLKNEQEESFASKTDMKCFFSTCGNQFWHTKSDLIVLQPLLLLLSTFLTLHSLTKAWWEEWFFENLITFKSTFVLRLVGR